MKNVIPLLVFIGATMSNNAAGNGKVNSLSDVRDNIDCIDRKIIMLLKERQDMVKLAATFKKDETGVRDNKRVEAVIQKVIDLAIAAKLDPNVAEETYRAMISSFINLELSEHRNIS